MTQYWKQILLGAGAGLILIPTAILIAIAYSTIL